MQWLIKEGIGIRSVLPSTEAAMGVHHATGRVYPELYARGHRLCRSFELDYIHEGDPALLEAFS